MRASGPRPPKRPPHRTHHSAGPGHPKINKQETDETHGILLLSESSSQLRHLPRRPPLLPLNVRHLELRLRIGFSHARSPAHEARIRPDAATALLVWVWRDARHVDCGGMRRRGLAYTDHTVPAFRARVALASTPSLQRGVAQVRYPGRPRYLASSRRARPPSQAATPTETAPVPSSRNSRRKHTRHLTAATPVAPDLCAARPPSPWTSQTRAALPVFAAVTREGPHCRPSRPPGAFCINIPKLAMKINKQRSVFRPRQRSPGTHSWSPESGRRGRGWVVSRVRCSPAVAGSAMVWTNCGMPRSRPLRLAPERLGSADVQSGGLDVPFPEGNKGRLCSRVCFRAPASAYGYNTSSLTGVSLT